VKLEINNTRLEKFFDPYLIEWDQGALRTILDLIYTHQDGKRWHKPIEYIGRYEGCRKYNEYFDCFKTSTPGILLCYSDHDRLIYTKSLKKIIHRKITFGRNGVSGGLAGVCPISL
jgi:hypothetical protein